MVRILTLVSVVLLCVACGQKAEKAEAAPQQSTQQYDLSAASNQKFLADYAAKPGALKTQDGLQYRVLKAGTGKAPQSGADMVTVKYKGWLINGKVFDQTQGDATAEFPAGQLIPGWV